MEERAEEERTYGVIVHGVSTRFVNIKDQKGTIQQMLADNYTVIPHAEISYVRWLTKEASLKRTSSIVVEFTDPEMANAIIYAGMAWEGQIHQCQLYDRACRVKQCLRCFYYGHIGTQCSASQTCGYCAELHETKYCRQKGVEGFAPRCPVCKGAHTAWSNACPARKKELGRVECAKQVWSIYWHVPTRANTTRTGKDNTTTASTDQETSRARDPGQAVNIPNQATIQEIDERAETTTVQIQQQRPLASTGNAPAQTQPPVEVPGPLETITSHASGAPTTAEQHVTPVTQQEPTQQHLDLPIDPRLMQGDEALPFNDEPEHDATQIATQPLGETHVPFDMQNANIWLDNLYNDNDNEWARTLTTVMSRWMF